MTCECVCSSILKGTAFRHACKEMVCFRLGVQVLLLVRDPRGTMQSRRHRVWCPDNPDCDDPAWLCRDLVSDFHTAKKFQTMFPDSFRFVI